jgi:hypothetical protein
LLKASFGLTGLILILTSCGGDELYAPPRQRRPAERVVLSSRLLSMSSDLIDDLIVRDIGRGPGQQWRWTGQRPALRVQVGDPAGLKFSIDFTIPDVTFAATGPVNVTFMVNDQPIGKLHCDKPGPRHWESAVSPQLVKPHSENILGAALDKVYVAERDGARLGMILSSIGLVR